MAFAIIHKSGHNLDVDIASTPEDVWDAGGAYPFPAAAAATTIISDSASDAVAGTGARTAVVYGTNAAGLHIQETVTMNGTDPVTLTSQFFRVYRVTILTAGSNTTNVGIINVRHGATDIARIPADQGQTQMAIYTIPTDFIHQDILSWYALTHGAANIDAVFALQVREFGAAFRTLKQIGLRGSNLWNYRFLRSMRLTARTDIRVRILSTDVDNIGVSAGFIMDDGSYSSRG